LTVASNRAKVIAEGFGVLSDNPGGARVPQRRVWEDLQRCPDSRPFWCAHPHCLWCNWDDDQDHDASAIAASLGDRPVSERLYDPGFPEANYVEDRRYVAWTCFECESDPDLVKWFVDTVRQTYPEAVLIRAPGQAGETFLGAR
jgi:hypothetical protein